jgi:perosamine synthetase
MLSFCQNKIITTGEGGAVCTNNEDVYRKLRLIRSHGRVEKPGINYFSNPNEMDYIDIGYNYRMSSLTAALGISQLDKVDHLIKLRRIKAERYNKELDKIKEINLLKEPNNQFLVYQLYSILLDNSEVRENLKNFLLKNNIYTKVYFYPVHLKRFYRKYGYQEGNLPTTEEISKRILSIPISPNLKEKDQNIILSKIKDFFHSSF